MKIMQADKVVAEPVFLCIDDVPILPSLSVYSPTHSGRSSGLIRLHTAKTLRLADIFLTLIFLGNK
jgi:hypothetical protein